MDSYSRFSSFLVFNNASIPTAITAIESCWLGQFWNLLCAQAEAAFHNNVFVSFLHSIGSDLRPVPPRRHRNNALEPRHGVIRSIFLRLKSANTGTSLQSDHSDVLNSILEAFGNKMFLLGHAQGFPQHPLFISYQREEKSFLKTIPRIHISSVP